MQLYVKVQQLYVKKGIKKDCQKGKIKCKYFSKRVFCFQNIMKSVLSL